MKLTYTYIRLDDGRRLIVPNERLAQGSVENHTIVDPRMQVEVSVWIRPDADADRGDELIEDEEEGVTATVAETERDGCASAPRPGPRPARARAGRPPSSRAMVPPFREHGLSSAEAS